jgi:hypothetical protein
MTQEMTPSLLCCHIVTRPGVCKSDKAPSHPLERLSMGYRDTQRLASQLAELQDALSNPSTSSPTSSFIGRRLTDNKVEGRSLNSHLRLEMDYRDGARPLSAVSASNTGSARSGNIISYDAPSRENKSSTPSPVPEPLLPQSKVSTGRSGYPDCLPCPRTQYVSPRRVKDLQGSLHH